MYDEAIEELEAQRDFLLANTWATGDPLWAAEHQGFEFDEQLAIGCLVDRAVCGQALSETGHRIVVPVEERLGIFSEQALQALVWTMSELDYDLTAANAWVGKDKAFTLRDLCQTINDSQFESAGEALSVLEASILNLKELSARES